MSINGRLKRLEQQQAMNGRAQSDDYPEPFSPEFLELWLDHALACRTWFEEWFASATGKRREMLQNLSKGKFSEQCLFGV